MAEPKANRNATADFAAHPQSALNAKLAEVWKRSKPKMLERLEVLDRASLAQLEGELDAGLRKRAESEAHTLAGSLGTFGLPEGSRLAREMEHTLRENSAASAAQAQLFSELAAALRAEVEGWPGFGTFPEEVSGERGSSPLLSSKALEADLAVLEVLESSPARVLAVDDDPAMLAALAALLAPSDIVFTGLSDPLRFWDELAGSPPDLLILDVQMPSVNGIELCRVVRNDSRWAGVPVIFLTALTDNATVQRVFAAGADDFVAKPIVGPELVTRISNHLERARLQRKAAEVDPLSGLVNRIKFRPAFADLLRLAGQQGQPLGLAVVQVDVLGYINDVYGRAAGDEVVRRLGVCFRQEFRGNEIAARWYGNDFPVALYGLDRPGSVRRIEDVSRGFAQEIFVGAVAEEFHVTLSAGVAVFPQDACDLDGLLESARSDALTVRPRRK